MKSNSIWGWESHCLHKFSLSNNYMSSLRTTTCVTLWLYPVIHSKQVYITLLKKGKKMRWRILTVLFEGGNFMNYTACILRGLYQHALICFYWNINFTKSTESNLQINFSIKIFRHYFDIQWTRWLQYLYLSKFIFCNYWEGLRFERV